MTVTRLSTADRSTAGERREALKHLCSVRETHGYIPDRVMGEVAEMLQVSKSHLRKMLVEFRRTKKVRERPASPVKIVLDNEWRAQVAYFVAGGNATAAWKALRDSGEIPMSMSVKSFQRRVLEWDPALRACAKGGFRAMVQHQFFNVEHIPHKGYAYGTDHTKLGIQVLPERGTKPIWPWLSFIVDLSTRLVISYKVTAHVPNTLDNLDILLEAVDGWYTADGVFVGGKPGFLRTDRGGDYISEALSKNLIDLDVGRQFTEPYSSHQNGRVERINGTVDTVFGPTVPGYFPGGEDEANRRVLQSPIDHASLITLEALDRRLGDFFAEYNNTPHSALDGMTPLQAWAADPHQIERADKETIVTAMTPRETRRLNKYGIEVRNAIYSHPTLATLRKVNVADVEVRYHEHDRARIEVFVDGKHACTATKSTVQPEHHRLGVLSARAKQRREAMRLTRQADYERVLAERERMREEGIDEVEMPVLPPDPSVDDPDDVSEAEAAYQAAIEAAAQATAEAGNADGAEVGLWGETTGAVLSGRDIDHLSNHLANTPTDSDPEEPDYSSFGAMTNDDNEDEGAA